ncbi:type II secretory pathway, component PulD [Spirochaeta africana DSM 8902]|uniref:Type II secretory pathway, component PulD n=2 Tax=Spirochaeta TaxID=146 RepID=H9UK45_SPIAZ|nr:type II secretory pathway, component PulD [Spirochaeta africana DSM 8902]
MQRTPHRHQVWITALLLSAIPPCLSLSGQQIAYMEFVDQPVTDILLAAAITAGISIIPDGTVSGRATHYFTGTDIRQALEGFLRSNHLYMQQIDGIYHVSRIYCSYDPLRQLISIKAYQSPAGYVLQRISTEIGITIIHDLDTEKLLSIQAENITPQRGIALLERLLPHHRVTLQPDCLVIAAHDTPESIGASPTVPMVEFDPETGYHLRAERTDSRSLLTEILQQQGLQPVFMNQRDVPLQDLLLFGQDLDTLLDLVLYQAGLDVFRRDLIAYVVDIPQREIRKQLREHRVLTLQHLQVQDLPSLFPQDLAATTQYRLDRQRNSIILSGTPLEIDPVEGFIRRIDIPPSSFPPVRIELQHIEAPTVKEFLSRQLPGLQYTVLPDRTALLLHGCPDMIADAHALISMTDQPRTATAVELQYIHLGNLLDQLPDGFQATEFSGHRESSTLVFHGSKGRLARLQEYLALIDTPAPQIRYQLLVIQYQHGESLQLDLEHDLLTDPGDTSKPMLSSLFGSLLSLNFDIVTHLGLQFATRLSAAIKDNTARIFVDTTLNGLSGEQIRFQNTDTYRYRDSEIDPDTGQPRVAGVTREITAGLILQIRGRVSGSDMVTMEVDATISKRGLDTRQGDPPPTSERIVQTQVRTPSGTPVIISGLVQQDTSRQSGGIPYLRRIPLLGRLFGSLRAASEDSELIIYLIPFIQTESDSDYPRLIQQMSDRLLADHLQRTEFPQEAVP